MYARISMENNSTNQRTKTQSDFRKEENMQLNMLATKEGMHDKMMMMMNYTKKKKGSKKC